MSWYGAIEEKGLRSGELKGFLVGKENGCFFSRCVRRNSRLTGRALVDYDWGVGCGDLNVQINT